MRRVWILTTFLASAVAACSSDPEKPRSPDPSPARAAVAPETPELPKNPEKGPRRAPPPPGTTTISGREPAAVAEDPDEDEDGRPPAGRSEARFGSVDGAVVTHVPGGGCVLFPRFRLASVDHLSPPPPPEDLLRFVPGPRIELPPPGSGKEGKAEETHQDSSPQTISPVPVH